MHNSKLIERRDRIMISRVLRGIIADLEIQRQSSECLFKRLNDAVQLGIEVGLKTAIVRIEREL